MPEQSKPQEARMVDEVKRVEGCPAITMAQWLEQWHFETPQGYRVPFTEIRALLLSQGLHIVGEADWAVLEEVGRVDGNELHQYVGEHWTARVAKVELAKRRKDTI